MPVYMIHGFRWPRPLIRIHIILHNLEDAAAEWLVAPATTQVLLENFHEQYPDCMEHLPHLRFVEQYDPNDTSARSQPYAYVADVCEEISLGIDVDEVRGKGVPNDQWAMIMELRDKLAPGEKVAWYVVVCGDEDRWAPGISGSSTSNQAESSAGLLSLEQSDNDKSSEHSSVAQDQDDVTTKGENLEQLYAQQAQQQPRGIKKLFSAITRKKSRTNLDHSRSSESIPSTVREQEPALPTAAASVAASASVRPTASEDSLKFSLRSSHPSSSSSDQVLASPNDEKVRKPSPPTVDRATRRASMPKLQTQNLTSRSSTRTPGGLTSAVLSPSGLSLIPDDEDQEVITGPGDDDDDDELAAPAPTVKHGKQQDLIARQRKRTSIPSFSAIRSTSPDTLRNISPIVRAHPNPFSPTTMDDMSSHPARQYEYQPHRLQREFLPEEAAEPSTQAKQHSPPASYIPSGAPSGHASVQTSRSSSPVKIATRQRSTSRMSALNALEGNGISGYGSSPPQRSRGARSRRSSVQTNSALNPRHSQYSMSSMSGAMATLYGNHERDFKHRQSITQEDLVAKGLDNMDFTALR